MKTENNKSNQNTAAQTGEVQVKKAVAIYAVLFVWLCGVTLFKHLVFGGFESSSQRLVSFLCVLICLFLMLFAYAMYGIAARRKTILSSKRLASLCACMALCYAFCTLAEALHPFLMPIFLTAFLLAPIAKRRDTFSANLFCTIMVTIALAVESVAKGGSKETGYIIQLMIMLAVGIFSGSLTAFCLSYERKRLDFILKGIAVCASSVVLIVSLQGLNVCFWPVSAGILADSITEALKWAAISMFSQLALSIFLQPVLEKLFNLLTNSRLIELTDHNSPLIRRLITEAPGTFNHCLTVANFAEVCATAIAENPYEARACAYYHDIGKLVHPEFFKENQTGGNPHDDILPEVSAEIIRSHTIDGMALCRKHLIPNEISDITAEHHGTMPISIFYSKAKQLTDQDVDIKDYSYPGPTPTTKLAAIIMICDSAEAAIRSMDSPDADKVEGMISSLISARIKSGQFDECDITLKELNTIKNTIVSAFGGVYHKRIQYPDK